MSKHTKYDSGFEDGYKLCYDELKPRIDNLEAQRDAAIGRIHAWERLYPRQEFKE